MNINHTEAQELHEIVGLLRQEEVDRVAENRPTDPGTRWQTKALDRALELAALIVSDTDPEDLTEQEAFEALVAKDTGYGTLAHLFGVILFDREVDFNMDLPEVAERIAHHADSMWDNIVGPALDKLEDHVLDDIEED